MIKSCSLLSIIFCSFVVIIKCTVLDDISAKLSSGIYSTEYSVHSSDNKLTMDCLKINYDNELGIFGIFHAHNQSTHFSQLYYSQFSANKWGNTVKISQRGSQGTVIRVNVNENKYGYFVGYELQNPNGNKIAIRYYESQQKIKENNFLYEYQLIPIVSNKQVKNVGTVSLEQIQLILKQYDPKFNQYRLYIKFHYSPDGSHDFPGEGYVNIKPLRDFVDKSGKWVGGCYQNYQDWRGLNDTVAEGVLRQAGCLGKIGQRDYFFLGLQKYYLYECNINPSFDWYSWRIFLYSPTLKQARALGMVLGGDIDIANPHISLISKINNSYEFTLTFFLPSQGVSPQKEAKAGQSIVKTKFTYP